MAHFTGQPHLYYSRRSLRAEGAADAWLLHRMIERLNVRWDVRP